MEISLFHAIPLSGKIATFSYIKLIRTLSIHSHQSCCILIKRRFIYLVWFWGSRYLLAVVLSKYYPKYQTINFYRWCSGLSQLCSAFDYSTYQSKFSFWLSHIKHDAELHGHWYILSPMSCIYIAIFSLLLCPLDLGRTTVAHRFEF